MRFAEPGVGVIKKKVAGSVLGEREDVLSTLFSFHVFVGFILDGLLGMEITEMDFFSRRSSCHVSSSDDFQGAVERVQFGMFLSRIRYIFLPRHSPFTSLHTYQDSHKSHRYPSERCKHPSS
jgi:hypothetical protein